jgi:LytS/YehU family sensor histidine kinase
MEMVRSYLAIMQVRFGDRLVPEIRVDPEAADALVPRLILQPLVENAIRHGIASRPEGGRVSVHAAARNGRLRLAVCDDGPGAELSGGSFAREGTGVSNTRRRLVEMFGADGELRLLPGAGGGLEVRVDVPLRRAAP